MTATKVIPEDALSAAEIAEQVGVTSRTVRNWTGQRVDPLPCYRVGGQIRISLAEVRAWIARRSGRRDG